MELTSAQSFFVRLSVKVQKRLSCGGARLPLLLAPANPSAKVAALSAACVRLCPPLTRLALAALTALSPLCLSTFLTFAGAQLRVADVKSIAGGNARLLIMQMGPALIGMFCFRNYALLSRVRSNLSNFRAIVTEI
ncbi:hypothetical protein MHYP_G00359150 [Metynnis hypsauchen]